MFITNLEQTTKFRPEMAGAEGVSKQIPLGKNQRVPGFSFRVFTVEPGGHTPLHSHPFEHLNYIISGKGIVTGAEGERFIQQGDFALIQPDEKHQYRNAGDEPFVMICAVPKEYE
jgi:quercetin dioxygenase-like cupin family protein